MHIIFKPARIIVIALILLFNLFFCQSAFADGVTIVTHGWNPSIGYKPVWLESFRNAVSKNHLGNEKNYGKITVTQSGSRLVATCDPWNFDLSTGSTGEILIILDWSKVGDYLTGGPPTQNVAKVVVDKILTSQNNKPPLAELPVHLVGHSRGGGMVCEIARLLGEKGIIVDHLTALDPHPLTTSDPQPLFSKIIDTAAAIYENVVFADVYLQNSEYPTGEPVPGSYNRAWGTMSGGYHNNVSFFPNHRNIYLMYQGTVDLSSQVNNGEAVMTSRERSVWFAAEEYSGAKTGFCFSRIKGAVDRKLSGLHNNKLFKGTGIRQNLMWKEAVWPNIADLKICRGDSALDHGNHVISIGTELNLHYVSFDYDSSYTVTIHADSDRNPYNNNDYFALGSSIRHIATGGLFYKNRVTWDTSDVSNGMQAYIYTKISDGIRTRYFYAPACLIFSNIQKYIIPVFKPGPGHWSGLGITNLNSTNAAKVTITIFNQKGAVLATQFKTLPARGQDAFIVGAGVTDNGWIEIISTRQLAGLNFLGEYKDSSTDYYLGDVPFVQMLSNSLLIPHVAQNATWDTDVYAANPNTVTTTISYVYTSKTGIASTPYVTTIPANGSQQISVTDITHDIDVQGGCVTISSAQGLAAFALYNNLKTGSYSYAGIKAVDISE